jgi:hypothetical protein
MFTQPSNPADPTVAPKSLPFLLITECDDDSKAVTLSTYWRCTACGQIGNGSRLHHGGHTSYGRFA